jgi:hypothetical protein
MGKAFIKIGELVFCRSSSSTPEISLVIMADIFDDTK